MWDRVATAILFGLAANVDNISVGLAYGWGKRRIRWHSNLLIAAFTTIVTLLALAGGLAIRRVMPPNMPDVLGGGLLLALAAWNVFAERRDKSGSGTLKRFGTRSVVGLGETLVLAAALSINNIGLAIAGGIGGLDYRSAALAVGGFSIATLMFGQAVGSNVVELRLPPLARACLNGNAALALTGLLILVGY